MVDKYIYFSCFKEFYEVVKWRKLYIISLIVLPVCFFANAIIARGIVIISFILVIVFIVLNGSQKTKNQVVYKKLSLWKKPFYYSIIYVIGDAMWNISKFIYYDFLFGNLSFSLKIFYCIIVLHFLIFFVWFLGFTSYESKTTQVDHVH